MLLPSPKCSSTFLWLRIMVDSAASRGALIRMRAVLSESAAAARPPVGVT